MLTKDTAYDFLHSHIDSQNLRKHCYAVASVMKSLAKNFGEDQDLWEIIGLIHDGDYEKYPKEHPLKLIEELEKAKENKVIINAIKSHAWGYQEGLPEPKTNLEWSLYCCDELTGLIVAVTLVRPEKKISLVTVENIMSKWNQKGFAAGVNRDQIALCEEKLGIKLNDFIETALKAMQGISSELGL